MAEAFLQVVLDNLSLLIQKEVALLWGVKEEMQKLYSTFSTVKVVLEDAEERQVREKTIKDWLRKLKDAAYDVDDVLDEFATEAARSEFDSKGSGATEKVTSLMTCFSPKNILFRHKIGNRMKEVRERLDQIAEERKFHLKPTVTTKRRDDQVVEWRQTGSILTQPVVYGRDEDVEKIVNYLLEVAIVSDDVSVYPIVGIGGLGKTTLAQLVFNDERVKRHFELTSWVCVSDEFEVKRVIKAIIESASGNFCDAMDLDPLQRQLQEMLKGKRYLIVLDDVWNEAPEKWDRLKYVLACGSKGASIIVTTRLDTVASIVGKIPAHHLSGLSKNDCWLLLKERAFGHDAGQERPSLVAIGKELVKKCGGVPLAAKALGGLLRFKNDESQWRHVLDSDLWNLPEDENSILPTLRLSYFNLPLKLRQCFAYCAIFPKDYKINKPLLIHLWMANGFISFDGKLEVEEIGSEICNELYWRSLFQDAEKDKSGEILNFKMHDLVHDLAQSIMEDECRGLELGRSIDSSRRIHHMIIPDYPKESFNNFDVLYELESLRTLYIDWEIFSENWDVFLPDFSKICKFRCLRVLSTPYSGWTKLSSIGYLKHLRYLDLSHTNIKTLPKSICSLLNLQNLKLEKCSYLQKLPNQLRRLKNLQHLSIKGCSSLLYLPPKIGQLTCLKTLSIFIVGRRKGCHLVELQRLDLRGELYIKHLERVRNPVDAKEANLVEKSNLHDLSLLWGNNGELGPSECSERVLEFLEPHPNIKMLKIEGYRGTNFPHWMNEAIFGNLVSIKLIGCKNCVNFPPLGKLLYLKDLCLEAMDFVQYLDNEPHSEVATIGFPSLGSLEIRSLASLERLARDKSRDLLPNLSTLSVDNCPKLYSLPCLTALKSLRIQSCEEVALFSSISNLTSLNSLNIAYIFEVTSFSDVMLKNLTALRQLSIFNVHKLKALPGDLVGLNSLEELCILGCDELECLPEQSLRDLNSLRSLEIVWCRELKSLPEGIRHLTSLKRLRISSCPQLAIISDDIKHLVSLQRLTLHGLPKSVILSEGFYHIHALEHLEIGYCPQLESLPNSLGNLTSLQSLHIYLCPKLRSLPTGIQNLTNLKELQIDSCTKLVKRCKKPIGEEWFKITRIPHVYLEGKLQI